jgi:hypothetical protein
MPTPDPTPGTAPGPAFRTPTALARTRCPIGTARSGRVRRLVRGLTALLSADWTVSVHDGPLVVCTYPPTRLPAAWSLARATRRCWPGWQTRLSAQQRGRGG